MDATGSSLCRAKPKGAYALISLGCPKNLVDSEQMVGALELEGYRRVHDPKAADFVVVNTCAFIAEARQESWGVIDEMLDLKRQGRTGGVIVAGCLAERDRQALLAQRPDIDAVVGVFARDAIGEAAERVMARREAAPPSPLVLLAPPPVRALPDRRRAALTPSHVAYLKISEGCSRQCTFCTIPRLRGPQASKPLDEVVDEAARLAAAGARELILIAQDTTSYGVDLVGRPLLAELLRRLENVPGVDWLRLMYLYPANITDELLEALSASTKLVPYLDLPLQHINDQMLRRMGRRTTRAETERILRRLREAVPGLAIRTTFIVGFPGETEQHFAELLAFVRRERFERMGAFTYSPEPDAPSSRLPDRVPEATAKSRLCRLMTLQQQIAFAWAAGCKGKRFEAILDRPLELRRNVWIGRSPYDAPEIDLMVFVTGGEHRLQPGDLVPCEVVAAKGYDLAAVAVGPPRPRRVPEEGTRELGGFAGNFTTREAKSTKR